MKKIGHGSVIISDDEHYWVKEHKNGHLKVINESGKMQVICETSIRDCEVVTGKEAMMIIKRVFY